MTICYSQDFYQHEHFYKNSLVILQLTYSWDTFCKTCRGFAYSENFTEFVVSKAIFCAEELGSPPLAPIGAGIFIFSAGHAAYLTSLLYSYQRTLSSETEWLGTEADKSSLRSLASPEIYNGWTFASTPLVHNGVLRRHEDHCCISLLSKDKRKFLYVTRCTEF